MKRASYRFTLLSLAAFFLLTFSFFASASEPIYATKEPVEIYHPFYVGAFGAFVIPDDMKIDNSSAEIQFNNSWAAGVKAGFVLPVQWLAAEVEYAYLADQDVDKPGTGQFSANNLMANLLLRYPKGMIRPYIGGGIGWSFADFRGSANNFGWQALAGINLEILPNLSMDIAYRFFTSDYEFDHLDVTAENHMILAGLNYHFGGTEPVLPLKEEPPPVVQEIDSDGDGVVDSRDQCPDTPQGCVVDRDGCPVDSDKDGVCDGRDQCPGTPQGCVVDRDGCPVDSYKDGVCDGRDKCPNTPQGCAVDQNGCPLDSDKDGVIDCKDKCPDTPEIAKVDEDGCPLMAVIRLYVQFDYKKTVVKAEFFNEIKKLGDFMKNHPNLNATIEGHTDNIASADYNLKLSKQRAEAVMKALIEREQIDPRRLNAVGYGLTKPIATNDTEEGRAKNRRVEALLQVQELKK